MKKTVITFLLLTATLLTAWAGKPEKLERLARQYKGEDGFEMVSIGRLGLRLFGGIAAASGDLDKEERAALKVFKGLNKLIVIDFEEIPQARKETFATGDVLNAKSADDAISLSINFDETGPSVDQLKETGANVKLLNQQDYKEIGDPQIDGNKLVVRRVTNEGEIDFSYLLVIEGTKGVMGSVKAPADKEADAEKALNSILASVKMK